MQYSQLSFINEVEQTDYYQINNRRYLGSKFKLLDFIKHVVDKECTQFTTFLDLFAGTGVVGYAFNDQATSIITNDLLFSNYICHYAWFSGDIYNKQKVGRLMSYFNSLKPEKDNYVSIHFGGKYFTYHNARKIGLIREEIENHSYQLNFKEKSILLTSLLYAMDKVANTCGHYDAFRRTLDSKKHLQLKMLDINDAANHNNLIYNYDANQLVEQISADVVYIDPPYNSRQYSDTYHLLENIITWDKPDVKGIAKKMDRTHIKSDYCTRSAPEAFNDLITRVDSKFVVVSYSNMGKKGVGRSNALISDTQIGDCLNRRGKVNVFEQEFTPFSAGKSSIDNHKERLFVCKVSN